jgi:uncharacterized protein YbcI
MPAAEPTSAVQQNGRAKISEGAVGLFRRFFGRGPTQARTYVQGDLVTVELRNTLTEAENRLIAMGVADDVLALRRRAQQAIRNELTALVEEQLGRKVVAFLSDQSLDPDIAVEVFVLERSEPGEGGGLGGR